mmetsp:Transcript_39778/g.86048  ORF Transcript_39778/g.86048 Transcript_39778/m.86048 type:complete len:150 (+) Transcript_39778:413-862(+)
MALQVESSEGSAWQLRSDYKAPGQVTNGSSLQDFEDGMEVTVPAVVTLKMVKENLDSRRQAARSVAEAKRAEQGRQAPRAVGPGMPGMPGHPRPWPQPHWPPPPGWHAPPYRPVGYPYPPPHWHPHHRGGPHPPPGFKSGRPLPDDMFQ